MLKPLLEAGANINSKRRDYDYNLDNNNVVVRESLNIKENFLNHVGTLTYHKNIKDLCDKLMLLKIYKIVLTDDDTSVIKKNIKYVGLCANKSGPKLVSGIKQWVTKFPKYRSEEENNKWVTEFERRLSQLGKFYEFNNDISVMEIVSKDIHYDLFKLGFSNEIADNIIKAMSKVELDENFKQKIIDLKFSNKIAAKENYKSNFYNLCKTYITGGYNRG